MQLASKSFVLFHPVRKIARAFGAHLSRMASSTTAGTKKLIIDTDAGIDDAQAILMALAHPHLAEVSAITTVHGNTSVENTSKNVLRLLDVAGRLKDIPVYKGCSKALVGGEARATHYHGLDGFGDVPDPGAPGPEFLQREHAVNALVRLTNEHPGEYTLVCLAPLTNIAMALRMDPEFSKNVKECYIMGGNYEGKGNITPCAEFNFFADPEAANVVLTELGCPITLACWELCLKHSFSWDWYADFANTATVKGKFIKKIEAQSIEKYYSDVNCSEKHYTLADQLCVASVLREEVVAKANHAVVYVDINGGSTRGKMITDHELKSNARPNARIVKEMNDQILDFMMHLALKDIN